MKKFIVLCLSIITFSMFSCKLWMSDDNFFTDIEKEVKVAKAEKINVYVGYAMSRQGKTTPDGFDTFKVEVPHEISAVTEPEYGFVRWAAFTTKYLSTTDQSKNKDVYFIDDEDYEARIKPNELTEDIVSFEDVLDKDGKKVEGAATVTIHKPRNDIYLVPIIAQRPTISLTIPAKGSSGVVKNMSIRINFTKPMDTDSFKNEISGEYDKIVITQGIQTFLPDGGIDFNDENITDRFELSDSMFSANKKMITLKFKEEYISEGYDSQSSVTITISREVRDVFGFEMTDDNEISFTVGSKKDSLAPRITWLSAGPDKNFEAFQGVYKDVGSLDNLGQKTRIKLEGASLAPTNDIEDTFYDNYVPNRIGKDSKLILRVFAEDLAGSGSGQSLDGIESDVTRIGIRAKHLYNSDGTADKDAKMTDIEYQVYVPQTNGTSLSGSYRDLVNNANAMLPEGSDTLDSSYGTLFEYDISKMPDGLIKVDVAAVDQVGNIGFFDGGTESTEYGNAWTTLFIVKDTTPPDADANKGYVQADLSIVPNGRGMFNAEYYKKLAVIESNAGAIKDKGNHRLVAPNSELKWIVNPGSDTTWINSITADSAKWKLVSEGYKPAESSLPEVDGPVDFTYALMDNLGNISEAVIFNSVTYDNTIPTLDALKIQGINGYISTSITGNILENQILYIPVSDETAGLESIEISTSCIKNEETYPEYDKPFASSSLIVKVDDVPVKYTVDGKKLTLENTIIGNTTVTIQGLQIADADNVIDDSTYRISVSVTDAALNTSVVNTCDIKNDSTAPVINYVRVKNINSGIVGSSAEEYWTTEVEPVTALYINLTETNTGAKVFDFAGSSIKLTSESELIWNGEALPIEIDTAANKLTVTDEYKTVITQATGGEVTISNVELTEENHVVLAISDLVTNTSEKKSNFTLTDNRTIDMFKYDGETPSVKAVVLKDQAPGTGGAAETGYTDNEYVEATVSVEATASGVYKLTITGASFDSTTLVNGKQSTDATEGFEISGDGRTITLRTSGNKVNRILKGTFDIKLGNVKLPANDGDKDVSFTVTSVANRTSDETSEAKTSIRLDKTAPAWDGEGVYVAETNASRKASIYPHVSTSAAGNVKIGGTVYFYTKDVINVAADIIDTNRKDGNVDLFIDGTTTPVAEYKDVAPGKHTVYAVDKAGNKSAEKIFYVVGDTEGPAAFDGYVTFTMPTGGDIYRGNAPTANASGAETQNYVIKQNASPYQIIVKLGGVTETEVDVHGNARTARGRFTELDPQTDKTLVEYYAFSTDGTQNWKPIGDGQITISLPLTGDCTPYTVYLKDGCGNISQYTVPVNWKVDGSITHGGKDLSYDSLYVNTAEGKGITYYKGNTTPVFSLTSYNDTCFYPNDDTVEAGINKSTEKFTLKSRLLAWPNNATVPSKADFYSTTIAENRFSPWSYLTLKTASDAASYSMTHNYPRYDNDTHTIPAYKLYYIVEDKLGNYTITQLVNETDGTELWMYDNTPPSITVETGAKINTIEGTNYYSDVSTLSLNMTDTQSGIEWDGASHYTGANVQNTLLAVEYSLANLDPRSDFSFKINGIKDYVQNVMPDTAGLSVNSTANWVKQTAPTLPDTESAAIIAWNGTVSGTSNYTSELTSETDGSRKISVKSPRSVTQLKFGFKVNTSDDADLLGWIIRTVPLATLEDFYSQTRVGTGEGKDITVLTRNANDEYEYIYNKTDTTQKWEEIDNKIQYFYAINRAGLICQKPIIVEFVENPVPVVSNLEYTYVKTLENVNYIKESSTIKFVTRKDIPEDDVSQNETVAITKCEFFIGNNSVLVKDFTASPVTEFTLTSAEASVLPALYDEELTVKLYTATEQSERYELTDSEQGLASSNVWRYDGIAPVVNSIKVLHINSAKEGTNLEEYWTTETTPQTALFINLTEVNTGAKIFDFGGSTVKLREDTVLSLNGTNLPIDIDTEANKLTITDDTRTVKTAASGGQVVITNVDLNETSTGNTIKLIISDYVINPSSQKTNFKLEDNTAINLFKYDGDTPTINTVVLTDRAIGEGGSAQPGYTNDEYVNASVVVTPTISGVYMITVDGATFDASTTENATTVNGKNYNDASEGFVFSSDHKTITLKTSNNTKNRIIRGQSTITIGNVKLPSGDGDKTVTFTVTSLANRTSTVTSNAQATIKLDKTAPAWVGDGIFVGQNADTTIIYPHASTSASGNIKINGTIYFYTKTNINLAASVNEANRKAENQDLCIDVTTINASTELVTKFDGVTPGNHTVYAVDKAGNRSVGKTFYVVGDTTGLEDFEGYVTFAMPEIGGDIYRGNADTSSTKNYVVKKNANPYQIIVKLPGVTASDKDVHGIERTALGRFAELDPLTNKAPIESYAYSTDGSKNWQPIGDGVITINLPTEDNATATPYTVYLKDGCGNESNYKVPVNWLVDGSVTLGGKTLGTPLYDNTDKNITYYKGNTTPVLSLTGFNDTCYYPSASASAASNTETTDYTLKSRVLAWTGSEAPTKSDFYSTSIDQTRLTPWSYLTLKAAADSVAMTHNYPKYDVTTAFKLYYIVEDKLGNYTITQLKNEEKGTELWMWDNMPPSITVGSTSEKINTVEGTNYYSAASKLTLNLTDTQSGIEYDGTAHYTGNNVLNTKSVAYPLTDVAPNAQSELIINGLEDYVHNVMLDSVALEYKNASTWVKQTVPSLPASDSVDIVRFGGTANGTSNYTREFETQEDGSKKITVKSPRSVTSLTFGFKVNTSDSADLLGWIITTAKLTSFEDFYPSELVGSTITTIPRNAETDKYEYTYSKSNTNDKWEDKVTQYFYPVNRAGLVCHQPIIIAFAENPVPEIINKVYIDVVEYNNINYLKASSTIKFETNVPITKCIFYKDNVDVLTKTFSPSVSEYTLNKDEILSTLTENTLTVKLYTATDESIPYELTKSSFAESNKWTYDEVAPVIKKIFVPGIKEGTTTDASAVEYWSTGTDKTDVYITLKEEKTGVSVFDFAGSTIKLTEDSELYKLTNMADTTGTHVTNVNVEPTENKLTINLYSQAIRDTSGADVLIKITNVQLVPATATDEARAARPDNKVNLEIYDISDNDSVEDSSNPVHARFALDDTTTTLENPTSGNHPTSIEGFNYDPNSSEIISIILADRAKIKDSDDNEIYVYPEFTNEREVTATVVINASESGIYKLTIPANQATFEKDDLTNPTTIKVGSENVLYDYDTTTGTVTFKNNKIFKGSNLTVEINNLLLPENDGLKNVTITTTNLGTKTSTAASDSITLDMTPPVWNTAGTGLYTQQTLATIYPRSSDGTEKSYGQIQKDNSVYFYTKGDNASQLVLHDDVIDENIPTGHIYFKVNSGSFNEATSPTNPYNYLGLTPNATACNFTIFVVDKAGNKTEDRVFNIVKDDSAPVSSDVESYITFKKAMKGDTEVGEVLRSNSDKYYIKNVDDETEPYKIIVKFGSSDGVASTDSKVNGTLYSAEGITRPETAYTELYKISENTFNNDYNFNKSPIEYFAVTEGSASAPTSMSDWISILDDSTKTVNHLTVNGGGSITVSLPKRLSTGVDCGIVYIHVKDGCGNTQTLSTNVAWTIDDDIGDADHLGNYFITFNEIETEATSEDADKLHGHVVIHNPYSSSDDTSGGMAINNGVTYYNTSKGTPKLTLKYQDTCYWTTGTEVSEDIYSLRGRLIAGNWSGTTEGAPDYSEFKNEENVARRWASNWVPVITNNEWVKVAIDFDLPTATSLVGSDSTVTIEPYELWYCVEDAVANYRIIQVKNWTSEDATADADKATTWLYDDAAPTLNQANDVSFERVNKDGSNYYYSTNSKTTYTIRDARTGIITNSELIAIADTDTDSENTVASKRVAKTTSKQISLMSVATPSGTSYIVPYVDVTDIIGNSGRVYLTSNGNWVQQNTPTLANTAAGFTGTLNGSNVTAPATSGRFYVTKSGSTTAGIVNTLMAERAITSVVANLSSSATQTRINLSSGTIVSDSTDLLGWVVSDTELNATALSAFYSNSIINVSDSSFTYSEVSQTESTFTFDKGISSRDTIWVNWFNSYISSGETTKYKYFYAVNKAGLICQKPVKVTFAENPIPAIDSINYDVVYKPTNIDINFLNASSTIGFTTNKYSNNTKNVMLTKAEFYVEGNTTAALTETFSPSVNTYTLTPSNTDALKALKNKTLTVKLYTATEESDEYELTKSGYSTDNKWTYDDVAPTIEYVKVNNIVLGNGGSAEYWSMENDSQTALSIKLAETNTGAKVFDFAGSTIKLRSDATLTWNGDTLPITVDTTANKLTINDDTKTVETLAGGGVVTLQNVDLTSDVGGNTINLKISDLVNNTSVTKETFKLGDTSEEISMFRYDGDIPTVNSLTVVDRAIGDGGNAETGFTNEEYVNATVNVTATSSGIYKITVSGAIFDSNTKVNGKLASDSTEGFVVSDDGLTITLVTGTGSSAVNRLLKGTAFDIEVANVKLPSGDGDKDVTFTVTSLSQRTSDGTASGAKATIELDKTAPVWVGDGVHVGDDNTTTTIYPHSSTSTHNDGNIYFGANNTVYFYTKNTINIAADVTEKNRKTGNEDLYIDGISTTLVSKFDEVDDGEHTIYAVDKAGNRSVAKTFKVVRDATAPAEFDDYITFTMPSGGNIYRGNADTGSTKNYVIKQNENAYKIIVKLTGVTNDDVDVHGTARTALNKYAELDSQTTASPIEYYSVDSETEWQAIGNGIITISIPLTGTHSTYTVRLKDGCSNVRAFTVPVNWLVDGSITTSGTENLGSTLYGNKAKNTTYYKGDTTPVFTLTDSDDSCYYPNEESGVSNTATENYTLKTRVLAAATEPTKEDFYSTSIDSSRFSPWSYLTLKNATDIPAMTHNYPKYDATTAYKLYYIVEDKLGNYSIKQIKNGKNELWMWDNTAPSISVVPIATSPSININTVGDKNYYSASSKLKLNVTDTQSGIKYDGTNTSDYEGNNVLNTKEAVEYPLTNITPTEGQIKISGLYDYVENVMGNSDALEYNGKSAWIKQTAPTLGDTSTASVTAGTKDDTLGRQSTYTQSLETLQSGSKQLTINAPRYYTSLTVNLKVDTADTEDLLGWVIKTEQLTAEQLAKFYSTTDEDVNKSLTKVENANNEYKYIYNKSNTNTNWGTTATQYFYAVNRAGLICQKPIIVVFATTPVPAISGNVTYTNIETVSDVNYIKTGKYTGTTENVENPSSISFTTDRPLKKINLISGSVAELYTYADDNTSTSYTIVPSQAVWSSLANAPLTMILSTANEDSDLIYLTKKETTGWTNDSSKATDEWTYDVTRPTFTISAVKHLDSNTAAIQNPANTGTYFVTSDSVALTLSSASGTTDIAKYQYKLSSASSWTNWTSDFTLETDITAKTYSIRAVDKAGNPGVAKNITVQKDVTGPSGSIGLSYKYGDDAVTNPLVTTSSSGNSKTVYFNSTSVNKVIFTPSITDKGAGLESQYISYKFKTDNGEWSNVVNITENSFTKDSLSVDHIYTFEVYAKDALGNTTTYTCTFNGKLPEATAVNYTPGTNTTLSNNTFLVSGDTVNTIYYNPGVVTGDDGNLCFAVSGKDASGSTAVSFFYTIDSGTTENGLSTTGTLNIPVSGSSGKTYKIWIKDVISNKKQVASYVFKTVDYELKLNGNTPTANGYSVVNETSAIPTIYYNKDKTNQLVLKVSGNTGAALPTLYTREVIAGTPETYGTPAEITSSIISLVAGNAPNIQPIHKKYLIVAKDDSENYHVLKTIELNGNVPSGTIATSTPQTGVAGNGNIVYFNPTSVNSIAFTNNVTDAAGNTVTKFYSGTVAETNKLTIDDNGKLIINCPSNSNHTSDYSIIAVDNLGNQYTLPTLTLHGAGPDATLTTKFYNVTEGVESLVASTSGKYSVIDGSVYYNTNSVKRMKVTATAIAGYNVSYKYKIGEEEAVAFDTGSTTCSFDLPVSGDLTATYKIIATDDLGNTNEIQTYNVTGNNVTVSVVFDSSKNNSSYVKQDSSNPNIIYYNKNSSIVSGIYLKKTDETDTSTITYKLLGSASAAQELTNMMMPRLGSGNNYQGTYQILSGTAVIAEFTIKGFAPSGNLNASIGKVTDDSWTDAVAATETSVGNYVSSISGTTTTIIYNPATVNKIKFAPEVTDCGAGSVITVTNPSNQTTEYSRSSETGTYSVPAITLDSSWTSEKEYVFAVKDNVGNTTTLQTYKFKAHTTAPATNTIDPGTNWNSMGEYAPSGVKGIENKSVSNYKITTNSSKYKKVNNPNAGTYVNGTYLSEGRKGDYAVIGTATESSPIKISIPLNNVQSLLEINGKKYVSYSISYTYLEDAVAGRSKDYTAESNRTTPWTALQEITSDAVTINLKNTDVPCLMTYVFVWLRDPIGNTQVYSLLMPQYNSSGAWRNWWTSDTTAPTGTLITLASTDNNADQFSRAETNEDTTTFIYNPGSIWNFKVKVNVSDNKSGVDKIYFGTTELTNNTDKSLSISNFASSSYNITAKDQVGNEAVLHTVVFKPIDNYRNGTVKLVFNNENYSVTPSLDANGKLPIGTDATIHCNLASNPTITFTPEMTGMNIQSMSYKKDNANNATTMTNNKLTLSSGGTYKISATYKNASNPYEGAYTVQLFTLTVVDDPTLGGTNNSSILRLGDKKVNTRTEKRNSNNSGFVSLISDFFTGNKEDNNFTSVNSVKDVSSDISVTELSSDLISNIGEVKSSKVSDSVAKTTSDSSKTIGKQTNKVKKDVSLKPLESDFANSNSTKASITDENFVQNVITQTVDPVVENFELTQIDEAGVNSVESVVNTVEEVIDSVNATDNEVEVAAEAPLGQSQFYEEDEVGFDMRSVYAAIAILFVAIFALVCFLIRRKKNL